MPKLTESQLQSICVSWFESVYRNDIIIAIPNGTFFNAKTKIAGYAYSKKLKKEGVKSGVPDLLICKTNSLYGGLWIEMKRDQASINKMHRDNINQLEFHAKLRLKGYKVEICCSYEDFQKIISDYMKIG